MNRRYLIRNALFSAGALSAGSARSQQENATPEGHHSYPAPPKQTDGVPMPNIFGVSEWT